MNHSKRKYSSLRSQCVMIFPYRIRELVHEEFQKFIKVKGQKASPDARYPTLKFIHEKIQDEEEEYSWSLSTSEKIIKSMGFRYVRPHAINHAALIGNVQFLIL